MLQMICLWPIAGAPGDAVETLVRQHIYLSLSLSLSRVRALALILLILMLYGHTMFSYVTAVEYIIPVS